jgi:heme exporter protein B
MKLQIFPLIKRDIKLVLKDSSALLNLCFLYFILSFMFAFSLSQNSELLKVSATAVIFCSYLFTSNLSISTIFKSDYENGILQQIYLLPCSRFTIILSKIISHWIATGLPIVFLAPIISGLFNIEPERIFVISITLLSITPILSSIAVMISTITLGLKNGGVVGVIASFPIYIPVLVFALITAESSVDEIISGITNIFSLFLIIFPLSIFTSAWAIKFAIED